MEIVFVLVPLSLVLVGLVLWALLWAVRSGQFEDLDGPAHRILMDDDGPRLGRDPPPRTPLDPPADGAGGLDPGHHRPGGESLTSVGTSPTRAPGARPPGLQRPDQA